MRTGKNKALEVWGSNALNYWCTIDLKILLQYIFK
jgi:hypothetical protein